MYCKMIRRLSGRVTFDIFWSQYESNHGCSVASNNSAHSAAAVASTPPPHQSAGQMMQHSAAAADYFRDAQPVTYLVDNVKLKQN